MGSFKSAFGAVLRVTMTTQASFLRIKARYENGKNRKRDLIHSHLTLINQSNGTDREEPVSDFFLIPDFVIII